MTIVNDFVVNSMAKTKTKTEAKKKPSINEANLFTHFISMSCIDASNGFVYASFIIPLKNKRKDDLTYACNHNQFEINMVIFNK